MCLEINGGKGGEDRGGEWGKKTPDLRGHDGLRFVACAGTEREALPIYLLGLEVETLNLVLILQFLRHLLLFRIYY